MTKYNVGAQQYRQAPQKLQNILNSLGLPKGSFLKPYLQYFDSLNLIMVLIRHEGGTPEICPDYLERNVHHIGGTSGRSLHDSNILSRYTDIRFMMMENSDQLLKMYSFMIGETSNIERLCKRLEEIPVVQSNKQRIDTILNKIKN